MSLNLQLQPSVMVHCRSLVSIKAERERERERERIRSPGNRRC